jgi:tRNA (guanine-N1)-methyltransferase
LRIDVFTLFPEWFDWFLAQRHVRNAAGAGSDLRLFNYRDSTPLGGGQVDDAPYGGGAGMVLRVDVVDAALNAAYAGGSRAGSSCWRHPGISSTSGSRATLRRSRTSRSCPAATRESTSG